MTVTPTLDCGGNVTGNWRGSASGTNGDLTYSLSLVQNDCVVNGIETSITTDGCSTTSPIFGYVDQGVFHYAENGSEEGVCYRSAALTIGSEGNSLNVSVTNCSKPVISLSRQ